VHAEFKMIARRLARVTDKGRWTFGRMLHLHVHYLMCARTCGDGYRFVSKTASGKQLSIGKIERLPLQRIALCDLLLSTDEEDEVM